MSKDSAKKRGCLVRLFRLAVVLLWLIIPLILLEGAARWLEARTQQQNAYIAAQLAGQPLPPVSGRGPSIHLPDETDTRSVPSRPEEAPESWAHLNLQIPAQEDTAWQEGFLALDSHDRDIAARAHQFLVVHMDTAGTMLDSWGPYELRAIYGYLLRRLPDALLRSQLGNAPAQMLAAVREACATRKPAEAAFTLLGDTPYPYPVLAKPDPERAGAAYVYVYCDILWFARHNEPPAPEDAIWDIPWHVHRANLMGGPGVMGSDDFETDAHGFRSPPVAVPKPEGVYRIVCVGGSTTVEGATNAQTYPAFLQQMLVEALPGHTIEVVNAGVAGAKSGLHIARLRDYVALDPDLIVVYMGINDLIASLNALPRPFFSAVTRQVLGRAAFVQRWGRPWLLPSEAARNAWIENLTLRNIETMATVAHAHGIDFALATLAIPWPENITQDERDYLDFTARTAWRHPTLSYAWFAAGMARLNGRLTQLGEDARIHALPVAQHYASGLDVFLDICHMTEQGMAAKARIIAHYLHPLIKTRMQARAAS